MTSSKRRRREVEIEQAGEIGGRELRSHPCGGSREVGGRSRRQEVQHQVLGRGRPTTLGIGAIVDKGSRMVFGSTESYIEHVATGQNIPSRRKHGVFVLQLDARPSLKPSSSVAFWWTSGPG